MRDIMRYLARCELFREVATQRLERIEACSSLRKIPAQGLIQRGTTSGPPNTLFLLAEGLVRVCHLTADGKESILAFVEPDEVFGELAICGGGKQNDYFIAAESCTVVMIPSDQVRRLMRDLPEVALRVTEMIELRRRRIEARFKNMLFQSNRERLVNLLLDLADQFGTYCNNTVHLRVRLSHQELANMIGSTRETVTVILGKLRCGGCVDYGRRTIVLTDPEQLSRSVNRAGELEQQACQPDSTRFPLRAEAVHPT